MKRVLLILLCLLLRPLGAEVRRIVILKVDGLSDDRIERALEEHDPRTGLPRLPWIRHVFVENGVRLRNFYVRGISLSVPSWSLLDTGRHLQIHGNVEFDRYTLKPYDYMNFFPFYLGHALSRRVDMPGVEVLDDGDIPLLLDHFPVSERWQSFELYQRGVRWRTLEHSLTNRFASRSVRDLIDEWATGFEMSSSVNDQLERELIAKLADPQIAYLDYFTGEFDHVAHLTGDWASQRAVLERLDNLVGRVENGIERSPLRDSTVLVMVSDHGMNSSDTVYSEGYDLLGFFKSAAGGGHHVLTNRYPMDEFKLRGLYPFVSEVVNESPDSFYLAGKSKDYPTAALDLDGNERTSVYLRNSTLNAIQILVQKLADKSVATHTRVGLARAIIELIDEHRALWSAELTGLERRLTDLRQMIAAEEPTVASLKATKWTEQQRAEGLDQQERRKAAAIERMRAYEKGYSVWAAALRRLLDVTEDDLLAGKTTDLIPKRAFGDLNTVYDLQNYVAGPAELVSKDDRTLDLAKSFRRVNYFDLLTRIQVRNTAQKELVSNPVDFAAMRVPVDALRPLLPADEAPDRAVWLYAGPDRQALILMRNVDGGRQQFRYMAIADLTEDSRGAIHFRPQPWREGLPLRIWEDPALDTGSVSKEAWLDQWHSDTEWLKAARGTRYSNGVTGIVEELLESPPLEGFYAFTRRAAESDFIVFANDHWNFNARSFNPGGNHGSFLRISTHSTLMFSGGAVTGLPRGLEVEEPYDSLSFVPTLLDLMNITPLSSPAGPMPGPVIKQVRGRGYTRSSPPPDEPSSKPPLLSSE